MNSTINKYVNAVKSLPLWSHTDTFVPISFPVKRQHGLDRYSLLLNPTNSKIQHIFTERHALIPLIPFRGWTRLLLSKASSAFIRRTFLLRDASSFRKLMRVERTRFFSSPWRGGRGLKKHGTRVKIHSGLAYINRKSNIASKPF